MKKNILFLLLTLFVSGEVFSQSQRKTKTKERTSQSTANEKSDKNKDNKYNKARIDTKDGSMFLGDYQGETEKEISIKILTDDIITINKDVVKRARTPLNSVVLNKGRYHRTKGLYLHYNLGFNVGNNTGGSMGDIGLGYRINRKFEVQTGVGFLGSWINTAFDVAGDYSTFFPVYVGGIYNLTHGSTRLFATTRVGYSTSNGQDPWNTDAIQLSGGAYFEPGIGVTFSGKKSWRTQIALTQIFQHTGINFEGRDNHNNLVKGTGNMWMRRVGVRLTTTIF